MDLSETLDWGHRWGMQVHMVVTSHYLQLPVLLCIGFPNIQVDRNLILQRKRQWCCQWNYTMRSFCLTGSLFPSTALIPGTLSDVFSLAHPAGENTLLLTGSLGWSFWIAHIGKTDLKFGHWRNFRARLFICEYLVSSEQQLKFISLLSVSFWVINEIFWGDRDRKNEETLGFPTSAVEVQHLNLITGIHFWVSTGCSSCQPTRLYV